MKSNELVKLFCKLISIPSPSGKELDLAKFIKSYLKDIGIPSYFDNTGKINNSNSGNLIVKLKGNSNLPTILLVAHMDTVEVGDKSIKPKIINGIIKSDGTTILGADNKASVACLLEFLKEVSRWKVRPTIITAFTTREESGKMGTSLLRFSEKIDFAFNFDGQLGFTYKSLGEVPFEIKLIGKAAHAAVEPEKGINAIKTAALLISKLPIGKDKKGNVLNIGTINGGTANNIVPDEIILKGQIRAYSQNGLRKNLNNLEIIIKSVCSKTGCTYVFTKKPEEGAPPASIDKKHKIIDVAKKAAKSLNLPFSLNKGSFTSDANFLSLKYPTLTVGRGGKNPHSYEESITVKELVILKKIIFALIKNSIY